MHQNCPKGLSPTEFSFRAGGRHTRGDIISWAKKPSAKQQAMNLGENRPPRPKFGQGFKERRE